MTATLILAGTVSKEVLHLVEHEALPSSGSASFSTPNKSMLLSLNDFSLDVLLPGIDSASEQAGNIEAPASRDQPWARAVYLGRYSVVQQETGAETTTYRIKWGQLKDYLAQRLTS